MSFAFVVAWLTPLALGTGVMAFLQGRPRTFAEWMQTLGCGYVLGALLCSAAVALLGRVDVARIVPLLAPPLLALAAGAWVAAWLRAPAAVIAAPRIAPRARPLIFVLLALLLAHAALMADEILLRPMYPWDAWAAWLLKPKAWMLSGRLDRFVAFADWMRDASGTLRTAQTWNYPEAVGRIAVWFASTWNEWNAAVVGMAWFALWIALLCGTYGQLRALGLSRARAAIAVYALGSLPLINVHVALAGYADLWIATLLAFACLAWMRALESGTRGPLVLAALFALMLPLVKREGSVWLILFAASMLHARMPTRPRRIALALAPPIGVVVVAGYLLRWPLIAPALDRLGLGANTDAILRHAPAVFGSVGDGLLAQYNWHLLWIAFAATLVVRARVLRNSADLRAYGVFLVLGAAFVLALFVLTPAGRWAESFTAVNRLSLQIVPATLVFGALLWREPESVAASASAPMRVAEATSTAS